MPELALTEHEEAVRSFLVARYAPALILLGGSRADGAARPASDWDLFLVGAYGETRERVAATFDGEHLDLELVPFRYVRDDVLRISYGPVRVLRVLLDDPAGRGATIVTATRRAYERGPAPLTEAGGSSMPASLAGC